ncbi:uncharacterized protein [Watersipora subatra]|uniref:uncharacterized protein n=1 Tax=Watersipora subatra TaxID=2589382 RepID=UPI00355BA9A6
MPSTMYRGCAIVASYILLGAYCTHVALDEYWFTSARVLSKEKVENGGDCTDVHGNTYSHLQSWSNGDCSNYTCFQASSANFIIKSSCREPLESENPDSQNCVFATDDAADYPHCCPVLDCADGDYSQYTTTPAPSCYDKASNLSCTVWKSLNGCDLQDDTYELFNLTWVYCQQTCEFC